MAQAEILRTIETVYREESGRLIAGLMRIVRDVSLAEELAHDALLIALEHWPGSGIPDHPGAWLMTTAKNRALNRVTRHKLLERKHEQLAVELASSAVPASADERADATVGDDLLRLIFIACHPVLSPDARVALSLRLLGGLGVEDIARAFLVPEATISQRIVRAKRTLAEERIPFELPRADELEGRLRSVLHVLYLIFNEGYSPTSGDELQQPALCVEALRLGRVLAGLMPAEPEVHGLLALMELNHSRLAARIGPHGEHVLLLEQERSRWDAASIRSGLANLERAHQLGGAYGYYSLQAAITACHARAPAAVDTDWSQIASLYQRLAELTNSPVVELNRAVAVSMAHGPAAGLAIADGLAEALPNYHLLPSVRADLLAKQGRVEEAVAEFQRAATLTRNARERQLLLERAAALSASSR